MESIADQTLGRLSAAIASQEPAPGAGVAAAAALALGIACARKAAAITLKHDPTLGELRSHETRLADLQTLALRLADLDARCFPAAIRHDEQAEDRIVAADEQLIACSSDAGRIVEDLAERVDAAMRNDILAARALIDAAAAIARANLAENRAAQSSGSNRSAAVR